MKIQLRDLIVSTHAKALLNIDNLDLEGPGIFGLLGPSGGCKSTLIKILVGHTRDLCEYQISGRMRLNQLPWFDLGASNGERWGYLPQNFRLRCGPLSQLFVDEPGAEVPEDWYPRLEAAVNQYGLAEHISILPQTDVSALSWGQHKLLKLAVLLEREPPVVFCDEPTRDMSQTEEALLAGICLGARSRVLMVMVNHDKEFVAKTCDEIILLSGGVVIEQTSAGRFFECPKTAIGQQFIRSGSAWPLLDAETRVTLPTVPPLPSANAGSESVSPRLDVCWVMKNLLGGSPKPGLLNPLQKDVDTLVDEGVDVLVTLTEKPLETAIFERAGILVKHYPINDMESPDSMGDCQEVLEFVADCVRNSVSVVFHCKAGLGRTGLMLACALVELGLGATEAIEKIRAHQPLFIQTDEQAQFVHDYMSQLPPTSSVA